MTKKRKKHTPEQIVAKLRDADVMLKTGKDMAAVLQSLEISEATYQRWRSQYGGMKSEEAKRLKEPKCSVPRAVSSNDGQVPYQIACKLQLSNKNTAFDVRLT
jgi:hypothetical protein